MSRLKAYSVALCAWTIAVSVFGIALYGLLHILYGM